MHLASPGQCSNQRELSQINSYHASARIIPDRDSYPLPRSGERAAHFIGNEIYRRPAFGKHHPLSGPRVALVMDLCERLGWLDAQSLCASRPADEKTLSVFHTTDYLAAFREADSTGRVSREVRERYHLGTSSNPLFPGLFERAATTVGGSILAAELAMSGAIAYHPSGGTHHGRPDRASGFCYFNDPVFAVLTLLGHGLQRVMYVDLDAHHGDGVQDAFAADPRVFTLSIHEAGRWPHTGLVADRGQGRARNLPVPRGFNDSELDYLMQTAVLSLSRRFEPQAVVITCGADGLKGDPLSRMELSNVALWRAVLELVEASPRTVVLGGGGYNPWSVVRCWTGLWGLLSGKTLPQILPLEAQQVLLGLECDLVENEDINPGWFTTLVDDPNQAALRPELVELAHRVLE